VITPWGERAGFVLGMGTILACCEQRGYLPLGAGLPGSLSYEERTAARELSGSEAGDKQRQGGCERRTKSSRDGAAKQRWSTGTIAAGGMLLLSPWSRAPWPEG